MELGPFYTGQIPREPLTFIVRDVRTNEVINLSDYTGGKFLMLDPEGKPVDTSEGVVYIAYPEAGEVRFDWPTEESLLTQVGDYRVQMELNAANGVKDFTVPQSFKVYRSLGGS